MLLIVGPLGRRLNGEVAAAQRSAPSAALARLAAAIERFSRVRHISDRLVIPKQNSFSAANWSTPVVSSDRIER